MLKRTENETLFLCVLCVSNNSPLLPTGLKTVWQSTTELQISFFSVHVHFHVLSFFCDDRLMIEMLK
jgi:hypothetical protein